ncbi:MAG: sulfite exporter TauE/SafE family protein [Balneolaceae bacterium]|nr:sulfite exporter TauE/SafE family protein [Balneolaceae bacterium]
MMEAFILLIIGVFGGLIAGSMGVGGGIIFTPVLYFLFDEAGVEQPVQWSVASGLLCTLFTSVSSSVRQYLNKNFFLKEGLLLGVFGAIGISIGKWILTSEYYDREQFVVIFSAVLFFAAYMMFKKGKISQEATTPDADTKFETKSAGTAGISGGLVAALAGVGGGGVMVPIMNLIYKQPFKKAVSISHLGMCVLIATGLIQLALVSVNTQGISPYNLGYIDIGAALPLAVGGLFGANFGTILNHKLKQQYLQWGFALLAVVMASRLLWGVYG